MIISRFTGPVRLVSKFWLVILLSGGNRNWFLFPGEISLFIRRPLEVACVAVARAGCIGGTEFPLSCAATEVGWWLFLSIKFGSMLVVCWKLLVESC